MNWGLALEFGGSLLFGVLSAVIPIFSCEIYIAAAQVGGFGEELTTAVGCAAGQAIGKIGMVLVLRRGGGEWMRRRHKDRTPRQLPPRLVRLRAWSDRLLALLGDRRWGLPIVLLSACVYVPPLYAVTLAIPATRMSAVLFGFAVFVGRLVPFLAIAFGVSALIS